MARAMAGDWRRLTKAITPGELAANIVHRAEVDLRSIADLDAELQRQGLPVTRELFQPSYDRGSDENLTEVEAESIETILNPPK